MKACFDDRFFIFIGLRTSLGILKICAGNLYELFINHLPQLYTAGRNLYLESEEKKMTNQIFDQTKNPLAKDIFAYQHADRDLVADIWTKYHTGACIGLLGGFVILLSAIFLTVFEYFSDEKSHSFWLFLAIYPLFAVGAHCLDKISDLSKQKKNISDENETQNF
jgi:hypothetical protein